jgi:hypothetical protein
MKYAVVPPSIRLFALRMASKGITKATHKPAQPEDLVDNPSRQKLTGGHLWGKRTKGKENE